MGKGMRLDALLVERGLFETRAKAKAAVEAGIVYVDGMRVDKAGTACRLDAQVEVRGPTNPFVDRGGLKLQHALDRFGVSVAGRRCIDVGASTGGFTDCLLQRGRGSRCTPSTSAMASSIGNSGKTREWSSSRGPIFDTSRRAISPRST